MPQRGVPGHVSLALVRLGDLGGKTSTATAENVKDIGGTLPPLLRRQDFLSKVPPGRYKLVVEFEPFDSPARLPSHGVCFCPSACDGSFTYAFARCACVPGERQRQRAGARCNVLPTDNCT